MKRISSLFAALLFSSCFLTFAQEQPAQEDLYVEEDVYQEETPEPKKAEPQGQPSTKPFTYKDYSHWSVTFKDESA